MNVVRATKEFVRLQSLDPGAGFCPDVGLCFQIGCRVLSATGRNDT